MNEELTDYINNSGQFESVVVVTDEDREILFIAESMHEVKQVIMDALDPDSLTVSSFGDFIEIIADEDRYIVQVTAIFL